MKAEEGRKEEERRHDFVKDFPFLTVLSSSFHFIVRLGNGQQSNVDSQLPWYDLKNVQILDFLTKFYQSLLNYEVCYNYTHIIQFL